MNAYELGQYLQWTWAFDDGLAVLPGTVRKLWDVRQAYKAQDGVGNMPGAIKTTGGGHWCYGDQSRVPLLHMSTGPLHATLRLLLQR